MYECVQVLANLKEIPLNEMKCEFNAKISNETVKRNEKMFR